MTARALRPLACPPGDLPEVLLLTPPRFDDARGWFSESFNAAAFAEAGLPASFVQDNHVHNARAGTVRGLHMQRAPHGQVKLVRCLRGAIWDVAVDVRPGSATAGRWAAARLDAGSGTQILIPEGFLHGYVTLEDDTDVFYKVSAPWAPQAEVGVRWDDADLGLPWPVAAADAILSDKDARLPALAEALGVLA